jgi:hypothetical protein
MAHNGNKAPRIKAVGEGAEIWWHKKKQRSDKARKAARVARRKNRRKK